MNTLQQAPILLHKGEKNLGKQYYALPQELMDTIFTQLGNSSAQLRIMIVLIGTKPNDFRISQKWMLERTGLTERSYQRARDELEKRGWIKHIPYESITVDFDKIRKCSQ